MSEVEELVGWLGEFVSNPWLVVADRQRLERISATITRLSEENARLRRCLLPVQMTLAQAECLDEPIPDDAVVLHFMGSGASDQVTAGEIRAALTQGESSRGKL